jgi:hypothetical protein
MNVNPTGPANILQLQQQKLRTDQLHKSNIDRMGVIDTQHSDLDMRKGELDGKAALDDARRQQIDRVTMTHDLDTRQMQQQQKQDLHKRIAVCKTTRSSGSQTKPNATAYGRIKIMHDQKLLTRQARCRVNVF